MVLLRRSFPQAGPWPSLSAQHSLSRALHSLLCLERIGDAWEFCRLDQGQLMYGTLKDALVGLDQTRVKSLNPSCTYGQTTQPTVHLLAADRPSDDRKLKYLRKLVHSINHSKHSCPKCWCCTQPLLGPAPPRFGWQNSCFSVRAVVAVQLSTPSMVHCIALCASGPALQYTQLLLKAPELLCCTAGRHCCARGYPF